MCYSKRRDFPFSSSRRPPFRLLFLLLFLIFLFTSLSFRTVAAPLCEPANASGRETGNTGEDVSCDRTAASLSPADGGNSHPVTDGKTENADGNVTHNRTAASPFPADGGGKTRPALSGSSQGTTDPALPTVTLPEEVAELLPEGADPDALLRLDLSYFLTFLLRQGGALLLPALRQLAALCAMLLLFSLLHKAGECGLFSSGLQSVLRLLLLSAAVLTVYPLLLREFTAVKEFFTMLSGFLSGFIPTMEMLYIAGGSGATAAVGGRDCP